MSVLKGRIIEPTLDKMRNPIVEALCNENPVILKTETLYGLCTDARSDKACQKIFTLKNIITPRPTPVLVRDFEQLQEFAQNIPTQAKILMDQFWPGPLSILLQSKNISSLIQGENQTIAFRISSAPSIQEILSQIDFPITATSANITHQPVILDPSEIPTIFPNVVFQNAGKVNNPTPSTVVDCSKENGFQILREGVISTDKLNQALRK